MGASRVFISKKVLVGCALVLMALAALWFFTRQPPAPKEGPTASNDIPVVIRTNGGLLEVATVRHRRSFDLTKVATVVGIEVPICKETATYAVDAAITYRVKLAKRWVGDYNNGVLTMVVPPPEPSIPVAFDTSRLRATLDDCALMPDLHAKDDLLRSISRQLANDARGPSYMKIARNAEAKATIREFARKWVLGQKSYDLPANVPIEVVFSDE